MSALAFPGLLITAGSKDRKAITAIQKRLRAVGCGPIDVDGIFGAETFAAVEQFQARSVDVDGATLTIDGKVGPTTWSALFGYDTIAAVASSSSTTPLLASLLEVLSAEVGTMEIPPGSNRGPRVDQYIRATGLNPAGAYPWCACLVYWGFKTAANKLSIDNPCVKTASVRDHWAKTNNTAAARRILPAEAQENPGLIVPGTLFLITTTGGGHTGVIESVRGNQLTTIEGNTNEGGGAEGVGVFRRTSRLISQISLGFIIYS